MSGLDEIRERLNVTEKSENACTGTLTLPKEFAGFQGHFPGRPILPGVFHAVAVQILLERATGRRFLLKLMRRVKFFAPSTPGMGMLLRAEFRRTETGLWEASATVSGESGTKFAALKLTLEEITDE